MKMTPFFGVSSRRCCRSRRELRMSLVHFQGKSFNITVIQVPAPSNNTKEDEVDQFYEDLQDLLEPTCWGSVTEPENYCEHICLSCESPVCPVLSLSTLPTLTWIYFRSLIYFAQSTQWPHKQYPLVHSCPHPCTYKYTQSIVHTDTKGCVCSSRESYLQVLNVHGASESLHLLLHFLRGSGLCQGSLYTAPENCWSWDIHTWRFTIIFLDIFENNFLKCSIEI